MFEANVISCSEKQKKDDSGKARFYYKVYIVDSNGDVGFVYANKPYKQGQTVKLEICVDGRTQKFTIRIKD
ncbi:MAG: hypothetical protein PHC80_02980 [Eubacteriales bacterium]|nr:hypothetical protein [Eubacteriales bacterium]